MFVKILNCKKGLLYNFMFIVFLIVQFLILFEYQVFGGGCFDEIVRNVDKLNSFFLVVFFICYNVINMLKYKVLILYYGYSCNIQRCKFYDLRFVFLLFVNMQSVVRDVVFWMCKCYLFIWLVKSCWVLILYLKQL